MGVKESAQFFGFSPLLKGVVAYLGGSVQVGGINSPQVAALRLMVETSALTDAERLVLMGASQRTNKYLTDLHAVASLVNRGFISVDIRLTDEGMQLAREINRWA